MKIAYKHLLKFLVDKPSIEELSSKLFQLGHEHEIENSIFDLEFTPNRGDCLSVRGLIRDLNVFYQTNIDIKTYKDDLPFLDLNFVNQERDACPQISFLNIEIKGEVSEYKDYLNDYFKDFKLNKNNFFADVSNYVAYEIGQPTHCYDFSSIGKEITLTVNGNDSKFTTLLNNNIDLSGSDLIFTSEEKIINLAGIMGGNDTACNKQTKNALIECAYFKPESIIGKAVKYNLHSEASHKFERGTDPKCHEEALRRIIQIISEHSEICKLGLYTYEGHEFKELELQFDLEKVNHVLGLNVSKDEYKNSLIKLGFEVDKSIIVPSFRSDINHQNDLAEELARVIGYDNIPVTSINLSEISGKCNPSKKEKIKAFLIDHNFSEVINSSFCSISTPHSIKVDNPLDINREYMRTNLMDSLLENVIYNEKRQKDSIKLFEVSDIYTTSGNIQENRIAIIISGKRGENYRDFSKKLDHAYLRDIFQEVNIDIDEQIVNIDRNKIDSKIKTPIFAVELKIDDLSEEFIKYDNAATLKNNFIKYVPISEFPSSIRDLSFSVQDSIKIPKVIETLAGFKSDIIKDSFMFDFYENKKINQSKIGFRFIFQSVNKTLTVEEIDNEMQGIITNTLKIKSVSLPGSN